MIETITHDKTTIAIILRRSYSVDGIAFVTPNEFTLQLGHMTRPAGYEVIPHIHKPVRRETVGTQEVLFIKSGRILIRFFDFDERMITSREVGAGDVILLAAAGHGITVLETATIVEVKNGPFIEGADKGRFHYNLP